MRVFTPDEVATGTESKYLGVLVAAKYARELNTLPRESMPLGEEKKLTTRSLEALTSGQIASRLGTRRRKDEDGPTSPSTGAGRGSHLGRGSQSIVCRTSD